MARWINLIWIAVVFRKLSGLAARLLAMVRAAAKTRLPRVPSSAVARWSRLPAFRRHLVTNLAVGLVIAVALHQFHHVAYLGQVEDAAIDWAMHMYRGTAPPTGQRPIAFIDIDESTYRAWDEPLFTPRDKLAALIRHAIDGGAAAIVVDIDLSRPRGPGDEALRAVLKTYAAAGDGEASLPPLILARAVRPEMPGRSARLPEERPSFLDPLVVQAPRVQWGTPLFDQDSDGKVRRWHLWAALCGSAREPLIRPSIQLLVKALLTASEGQRTTLTAALTELTPHDCHAGSPAESQGHRDAHPSEVVLGDKHISLRPEHIARRILYRTPWHLNEGESRPLVDLDGRRVPAFSVQSAGTISDASVPVSGDWLRGHVAIIGSSYLDSRDLYDTPIGPMPGSMVIANAIQSLDVGGELRTPGLPETLLIESLLILLMSVLFARYHSFGGSLLSSTAVILLLLPLSLWVFNLGLWLSFAIPLFAVQIHQLAAELEEVLAKRSTGGPTHD
jgi:CHASE2 domain-containing sensor protein